MHFDSPDPTFVILVVDDEEINRLFVREALEQVGFQVYEASNGVQALEQFSRWRPDLIIMDVMMPEMDGFSTCAQLRDSSKGNRVPILIMTALEDDVSIGQAYEYGATDFITKPIHARLLAHRVQYMLRGSITLNALLHSEARLALAQRIARVGNWEWNPSTGQFRVSPELCRLLELHLDDFGGTKEAFLNLVHEHDRPCLDLALTTLLEKQTPCDIDHRMIMPNGIEITINLQAEAVFNDQLKAFTIVGMAKDISERKRAEREIHQLAYYDSLTGLPNRVLFKDRVTQAIAHANRYQSLLAILFLDLDHFKVINDTLGHTSGDHLLKQVAERLAESVRHSDSVGRSFEEANAYEMARLGGDEFTILLTNIRDAQDARKVARRMLESLARPFFLEGHEASITASVGIAIFPTDGDSLDQLLKNSDTAMYQAKAQGRNNAQFYSASMNSQAEERLTLENDLRKALERQELIVYYQPQVDMRSNQIIGAEALVRWHHPRRGILLPSVFFTVANETGMIRQVDEAVLQIACRQSKSWQDAGHLPIRLSVNVSRSFFHGTSLTSTISRTLRETQLPPESLELEFTESIALHHVETSIMMLRELRTMGIQLAIDDFGTGYSSLSHLQRLPLNRLKIDQSFVHNLDVNPTNALITSAIISLAHSLKLKVLVEGVETEEQLTILRKQGCDEAQGYFLGHPMSGEEFVRRLSGTAPTALAKRVA